MNTSKSGKRSRRCSPKYHFSVLRRWFVMPDGVRLGATIYMPVPKSKAKRNHADIKKFGSAVPSREIARHEVASKAPPAEKFPVLLEILPYRKDESFQLGDYPTYSYFASRGFITVKVDIRGTGSSQGTVPDREYSDIEFEDAEEIIRQLSVMPGSNGNVAMFGVSWSGFNSIQLAMRRPPALKAILAMHASDDLFHDDLHYIDGVLHLDPYHLYINHELGLPRTPTYKLDDAYFANRFDRKPWLFRYLATQRDGEFWRSRSLCTNYGAIDIPVYIIGGLLDGYRDTVIRLVENLDPPVKADIGPWGHYCPDDGVPGPHYEWQEDAIAFFSRYMTEKGARAGARHKLGSTEHAAGRQPGSTAQAARQKSAIAQARTGENGKHITIFVRDGHKPDVNQETTPGHWRYVDWPITGTSWTTFFPGNGKLVRRLATTAKSKRERLASLASSGTAAGTWWGDSTGNMREDDASALVFDSSPVGKTTVIAGIPEVRLKVSSEHAKATWSVRLEDVAPDGTVALVTGALFNGCHASGRLNPSELTPGETLELPVKLHFTTWTFQPGHRIRLAVANAQFPMAWPTGGIVKTDLHTSCKSTFLSLPVIPKEPSSRPPFVAEKVVTKLDSPYGGYVDLEDGKPEYGKRVERDIATGVTSYISESRSVYEIKGRQFINETKNTWSTNDSNPACSGYRGRNVTSIASAKRTIVLKTLIEVNSDETSLHVSVTRDLIQDGKRIRRKRWQETIAREHH